jgi:hypothetical protein
MLLERIGDSIIIDDTMLMQYLSCVYILIM